MPSDGCETERLLAIRFNCNRSEDSKNDTGQPGGCNHVDSQTSEHLLPLWVGRQGRDSAKEPMACTVQRNKNQEEKINSDESGDRFHYGASI